ncbi:MAG: hypothetical protein A2474_03565 [Elusimicrobia bacterium RIFOXYC2_FULL_34_12]|nr:MAG: hypothetical protein A2474_03565 [Elusimicrobia bacterium RIFOXYC2_FULL_34_12]
MHKKHKIYLILILLISIILRLGGIKGGLPNKYHTVTYHPDENTHLIKLQAMEPSKLNFNPVSEKLPTALGDGTFHLYTYAAIIKILSFVKYITIVNSEDYYFSNIGEWAKFFYIGRLLSVIYGVITVCIMFLVGKKYFSSTTGLLSAFLLAITPVHVTYSQYFLMNVPGLFWIVISFIFFKNILDRGENKDYIFAGICIGLAISTRYSAGPLFLILIISHFLRSNTEIKKLLFGLSAMLISYLLGSPYVVLDFKNFLIGIKSPIVAGGMTSASVHFASFPLLTYLQQSMGTILLIICISGIMLILKKIKKANIIILSWIAILLIFFIKAGDSAIPGRILPIIPFLIILSANFTDYILTKNTVIGKTVIIILIIATLPFSIALLKLRNQPDIRDVSSEWIEKNVTANSSFGLFREPSSWLSPGIIDRKYRHPEYTQLPNYKFVPLHQNNWAYDIGYTNLNETKPNYLVISNSEVESLNEPDLTDKLLNEYNYKEIVKFKKDFSIFGIKVKNQIPHMVRIPDYIIIFKN